MSPMIVVAVVVAVVVVLAVVGVLVYRARRETDPEVLAARDEAKARKARLRQVTKVRNAVVGRAKKELTAATKARDKAIKDSQGRLAELRETKGKKLGDYQGVTVYELWIETPHGSGSVAGMDASVDSQPSSRVTATRVLAFGVLALAAQKKTGAVYLSMAGPSLASVVACPQDENSQAREFATAINNASRYASATLALRPEQIEAELQVLDRAGDMAAVDRARVRLSEVEADQSLLEPIRAAQQEFDDARAAFESLRASRGRAAGGQVVQFDPIDDED